MSNRNACINNAKIDTDEYQYETASEIKEELDDSQFLTHTNLMISNSSSFDDEGDEQMVHSKPQNPFILNLDAGWDDSAIIRCFDLAMQTHDSKDVNKGCANLITMHSTEKESRNVKQENQNSDVNPPPRWRPGDLPLPQWAVDPWFAIRNGTYLSSKLNSKSVVITNDLEKSLKCPPKSKIECEMNTKVDNQYHIEKKRLSESKERDTQFYHLKTC